MGSTERKMWQSILRIVQVLTCMCLALQVHAGSFTNLWGFSQIKKGIQVAGHDTGESSFNEALFHEVDARLKALDALPEIIERIQATEQSTVQYRFTLKSDKDGYADDSWEEIIQKGQAIQSTYWQQGETFWRNKGYGKGSKPGWLGTVTSPVITIVCSETHYRFRNTVRLPGKFHVVGESESRSTLQFECSGSRLLGDNSTLGDASMANVGLYIEPSTKVQTANGNLFIRNMHQEIRNVTLSANPHTLPVYIAQDPDRFRMDTVKILQKTGARFSIKHGPVLSTQTHAYPVEQSVTGLTSLAHASFANLELNLKGKHRLWTIKENGRKTRKNAAMFLSGRHIHISNLHARGWAHVIYCHGGEGRVIDGVKVSNHSKKLTTAETVAVLLSIQSNQSPDKVSNIEGDSKVWILPKGSKVPSAGGWHSIGDRVL